MVLVYYLGNQQANRGSEARKILDEAVNKSDSTAWPYPVVRYFMKEITAQDLLSLANDNDKMAEARTYIGMELSLSGKREEAVTHLQWVKENGKRTLYEYNLALSELHRIEASAANSNQR
jgi:lipoprotein NlpI